MSERQRRRTRPLPDLAVWLADDIGNDLLFCGLAWQLAHHANGCATPDLRQQNAFRSKDQTPLGPF